ncbi:MAG: autotransporter outer membrane beta-barrel domain-containing protein [Deltaproteobacteria bacterium]|jgi:hypothetical protein|nr:autotransporter outer membrane beta-barrel domain-containing protein [Deltaproteobacteria bacterium]
MKLFRNFLVSGFVGLLALLAGLTGAGAEDIDWTGTNYMMVPDPTLPPGFYALIPKNDTSGNMIILQATLPGSVFGGYSYQATGPALSQNNQIINRQLDIVIKNNVYGGYAQSDDNQAQANSNHITFNDVKFNEIVTGGYAETLSSRAEANDNIIQITTIGHYGYPSRYIKGGSAYSDTGDAYSERNKVDLKEITLDDYYSLYITGGESEGAKAYTMENQVSIENAQFKNMNILGGYSITYLTDAISNDNKVSLTNLSGPNGTPAGSVIGGAVSVDYYSGASSSNGSVEASNNNLNIENSNIKTIYGAQVEVYGSDPVNVNLKANENELTIKGGKYTEVSGTFIMFDSDDIILSSFEVTDNIVTIEDVTSIDYLTGFTGYINNDLAEEFSNGVFIGNTLNVISSRSQGTLVTYLTNFQNYNFTFTDPEAVALTLDSSGEINLNNSVIQSVNTNNDLGKFNDGYLTTGAELILIDATTNGGTITFGDFDQSSVTGKHGSTMVYNFVLDKSTGNLVAKIVDEGLSQDSKAFSEGLVGSISSIIFGSDQLSSTLINEAMEAATLANISGGLPLGTFGTASGGSLRYKSGSHVDVNSFHLSVGLSYGADLTSGRLTLGIFGEYGLGSYDTYNSFPSLGVVLGHGQTKYLGIGLLGRFELAPSSRGNFYAELTARLGTVENEFWSDDLLPEQRVKYSSRSPYHGLHLGLGYKWKVSESGLLDTYVKYLWNQQKGDQVVVSTGEKISFRAVNSHRVRVGARYTQAINEYVKPYIGAAYEHEFDGRARAYTNGLAIEAPSLRGGTGIGELGIKFTSGRGGRLSLDLGLQGYLGKRQGFSGSLTFNLEF